MDNTEVASGPPVVAVDREALFGALRSAVSAFLCSFESARGEAWSDADYRVHEVAGWLWEAMQDREGGLS